MNNKTISKQEYSFSVTHKTVCFSGLLIWSITSVLSAAFFIHLMINLFSKLSWPEALLFTLMIIGCVVLTGTASAIMFVLVMFPIGLIDGYFETMWINKHQERISNGK